MGASDRTVRHLRLRADSEADVRRAVSQLDDALRCASLPDVGARVLLVRRLNLGRLPIGASSQTLSLLLEQHFAAVGGAWVHGNDAAENTNHVFFHNALDARCELALRLCAGKQSSEWYWPLAVPEFRRAEGALVNLRAMMLYLAAQPEAPAIVPALIAALLYAGNGQQLASAIGAAEAGVILRAARVSVGSLHAVAVRSSTQHGAAGDTRADASASPKESVPQRIEYTDGFDDLPDWVCALASVGGYIPRRRARSETAFDDSARKIVSASQSPDKAVQQDAIFDVTASVNDATNEEMTDSAIARSARDRTVSDALIDTASLIEDNAQEAAIESDSRGLQYVNDVATVAGGLLFLLSLLARLGYAEWSQQLPDAMATQIVQQVFARLLHRLKVPADDVVWSLTTRAQDAAWSAEVARPTRWADPVLEKPRGSSRTMSDTSMADDWLIMCRRLLRRSAGMGLADLVLRPARVAMSATHVDLNFRMHDIDMHVRRNGLDIDPGWLQWYGRVVSFHYRNGDFT